MNNKYEVQDADTCAVTLTVFTNVYGRKVKLLKQTFTGSILEQTVNTAKEEYKWFKEQHNTLSQVSFATITSVETL